MSALEQSPRRELVFTASQESWERIDQVMALQGHHQYSLTVARGFALVQWVLEQQAAGRVIGAMDSPSADFLPLTERPELLAPRPRMQIVPDQPTSATEASTQSERTVDAQGEPAAASPLGALKRLESSAARQDHEQCTQAAKKGSKNAPLQKAKKLILPRRKAKVDIRPTCAARSPLRSLEAARAEACANETPYPIEHDGKPLPWNLEHKYMASLLEGKQVPEATHFQIEGPGYVGIYAHRPKKDWCFWDPFSRCWRPDMKAREGMVCLYSIQVAIDYLQIKAKQTPPEPEVYEEVMY